VLSSVLLQVEHECAHDPRDRACLQQHLRLHLRDLHLHPGAGVVLSNTVCYTSVVVALCSLTIHSAPWSRCASVRCTEVGIWTGTLVCFLSGVVDRCGLTIHE
jgi:hypothetical protein